MILRRYATIATAACGLSLALAAPALADTVSMSSETTGPGSAQTVVTNNMSETTVTNTNVVVVTNNNVQQSTTGNVNASKNTSVGSVQSGDASNNNSTTNTVVITNSPVVETPVGGNGNGAGNGAGQPAGGSSTPVAATQGGHVLGAATVGGLGGAVAMLPVTGPSEPVDVSALRAAWHPQVTAPTAALAKGSRMFSGAMLLTATLLSLLGAIGSAWYAKRREERV